MTSSYRRLARRALILIAAVSAALCLAAPGAAAAPAVEVTLGNDAQGVQRVLVNATSGQFKLTYGADSTPDLSVGLSAAEMRDALDALPSIDGEGGSVSVYKAEPAFGSEYFVHFDGGPLSHQDPLRLGVALGTIPLRGLASNVSTTLLSPGEVSRSDERLEYTLNIRDSGSSPVGGGLTAKVELPAGQETSVYDFFGDGWTCTAAPVAGALPASATCTRTASDPLSPGASYPQLRIIVALGADAPEHAVAVASVSGADFASVSDSNEFDFAPARVFEASEFEASVIDSSGAEYTQAGAHPFASVTSFAFPRYKQLQVLNSSDLVHLILSLNFPGERTNPIERVKGVDVDLPRGFVGNALAVPELCPSMSEVEKSTCPVGSVVGGITFDNGSLGLGEGPLPIYAIQPEFGTPAQFAFSEPQAHTTYTLSSHLRADDGYAISLEASPVPVRPGLYGVENVTLCSFGGNFELRGGSGVFQGCKEADDPTANPKPLVTDPTHCVGPPPTVELSVDSWEHPGEFKTEEVTNPLPTGCSKVDFQPVVDLQPTSHQADSPTGMDVEIAMPTEGLEDPQGIAQANLDNVTVTFPKGMSVNPSASQGLGSCTPEEAKLGSNADDECPLSSKVGTVEVDTPLIQDTLTGNVYLASQRNNPFDSSVGLYLVFSSKKDGITIKVAGKVVPDPITGQLTSVFTENPEAPFSRLALHLNSGSRAPLVSPPRCGSYGIHAELSPWSAADPANPTPSEIVASDSNYVVTSGPGGGPCPTGALDAKFEAGLQNPTAGATSPFVLKLSREDGSQRFTGLDLNMPTGLTAYLKGVPYCPENVLAGISSAELTGRSELATPACPAASQVGTVEAGAGAGPNPFYAPGRVYLAGPYKGAPLSLAIVTPAVAGPFDLGNVVVRSALYVDPTTAQVTVKSDPIPTIVHGFLLDVRVLRVNIDRPGFTTAPTSCEPKGVDARVQGEAGDGESLSNRFQVGSCGALGFEPKLALHLKGATGRSKNPALRAVLTQPGGQANIGRVAVTLPKAEFIDNRHINSPCTRVEFNSGPGNGANCSPKSILGYAKAYTPLLAEPLQGPVYFRSNGGERELPDLVASLDGQVHLNLVGFIDSVHKKGSEVSRVRNTFALVPDAPVSRFVLNLKGGKKGLLQNSKNLCKLSKGQKRVRVNMVAQNNKRADQSPVLSSQCGNHKGKHRKKADKRHAKRDKQQHSAGAKKKAHRNVVKSARLHRLLTAW